MSACLRNITRNKKPAPMKVEKKQPDPDELIKDDPITQQDVEVMLTQDPGEAAQAGVNPMIIPDFFNNLRGNYYEGNRIIWLYSELDMQVAAAVLQRLNFYDDGSKDPVTIYVSSPGGVCAAGMAIVDMMEKLKTKGIPVATVCAGQCASMASVILSAGSKGHRYAFPSSRVMIHEVSGGAEWAKNSDFQNEARDMEWWNNTIAKTLAKNTGKKLDEIKKDITRDNYMTASEAKKYGLVDKVEAYLS